MNRQAGRKKVVVKHTADAKQIKPPF